MQPYPPQDNSRESRIVNDVCVLLHDDNPATQDKVKRWIQHVLYKAREVKRFWFLENLAVKTLNAGQDVVDLVGHLDTVHAVYGPTRLENIPLSEVAELRADALVNSKPNAGKCLKYAAEAGRRIHLWPVPSATFTLSVLYSRPIHVETVPFHWESIILDGVLGFYGKHFDRDALMQDPTDFIAQFYNAVRRESDGTQDVVVHKRYRPRREATTKITANSASDTAIEFVQPASLTGDGYVSIELGYYPQYIP